MPIRINSPYETRESFLENKDQQRHTSDPFLGRPETHQSLQLPGVGWGGEIQEPSREQQLAELLRQGSVQAKRGSFTKAGVASSGQTIYNVSLSSPNTRWLERKRPDFKLPPSFSPHRSLPTRCFKSHLEKNIWPLFFLPPSTNHS